MTQSPTSADCLAAYNLNIMELDGLTKPVIDGKIDHMGDIWGDSTLDWNGSEYTNFLILPIYESGDLSGKNASSKDGIAFIGYDCNNTRFCVAAYLNYNSTANENCTVNEDDQESFVQIGKTKNLQNLPMALHLHTLNTLVVSIALIEQLVSESAHAVSIILSFLEG
jgi:hypothetical protein